MGPIELTAVYEVAITPGMGYHLRKAVVLSRKNVRSFHAYECMNWRCFYEFRLKRPDWEHGVMVHCPECGSLYVEWLSFELDPGDVFLGTEEEWDQIPRGRLAVRKVKI